MSSQFASRYRLLSTPTKTLLSVVNKECGFGVAAELCEHLTKILCDGVDDKFWDNLSHSDHRTIVQIARAQSLTTVGSMSLLQTT
jgi:uncharacterized protein YgfB (UPF0149 family)